MHGSAPGCSVGSWNVPAQAWQRRRRRLAACDSLLMPSLPTSRRRPDDNRGNQAQLQCSWVTCSTSPGATVVPTRLTMRCSGGCRARPGLDPHCTACAGASLVGCAGTLTALRQGRMVTCVRGRRVQGKKGVNVQALQARRGDRCLHVVVEGGSRGVTRVKCCASNDRWQTKWNGATQGAQSMRRERESVRVCVCRVACQHAWLSRWEQRGSWQGDPAQGGRGECEG